MASQVEKIKDQMMQVNKNLISIFFFQFPSK